MSEDRRLKIANKVLLGVLIGVLGAVAWSVWPSSEAVPLGRLIEIVAQQHCNCASALSDDEKNMVGVLYQGAGHWGDVQLESAPELGRCAFHFTFGGSLPKGVGVKVCENGQTLRYDFFDAYDASLADAHHNTPTFTTSLFSVEGKLLLVDSWKKAIAVKEPNKPPYRMVAGVRNTQE